MLYGSIEAQLRALYAALPRGGSGRADALPAFHEWHARCKQSTVQTLRDVWTQMLMAANGMPLAELACVCVCRCGQKRRSACDEG